MNEDKPKLALRVFKRTNKYLVLLWKRLDGVDPLTAEINFRDLKNPGSKNLKIDPKFMRINEPTALGAEVGGEGLADVNISSETVICLINEKEAGLDSTAVYYVKIKYGAEEEGIRLTPAGVFPSHEREDRQKNHHLYLWDDESQCWRKASGIRGPRGQFYLGVSVMDRKEESRDEDE